MTVPVVAITVNVFGPDGAALSGAIVKAKLNAFDIYQNQLVYPVEQTATTNGSGVATLNLFPNALGERNTFYQFTAQDSDGKTKWTTTAVLPNVAKNLAEISDTHPPEAEDTGFSDIVNMPFLDQQGKYESYLKNNNRASRTYTFPDMSGTVMVAAAALAAGLIAITSVDPLDVAYRTLTGTVNQVNVANGDGVSGNPTLSLPQNIHTAATPTFASLTLTNGAPSAPNANAVLHVHKAAANADAWVESGSDASPAIGWKSNSVARYTLIGDSVAWRLFSGDRSAELFRVVTSGRFLIGTTTDDGVNKLQVNGNAAFTGLNAILQLKSTAANDGAYIEWFKSSGATRKGYLGYAAVGGTNWFALVNEEAAGGITIRPANTDVANFTATGLAITGTLSYTTTLSIPDGNGSAPSLRFTNSTGTGFYRVGAGSVGVADRMSFKDASAATPSISFENDPDLGFFRASGDAMGFAAGGVEIARVVPGGVTLASGSAGAYYGFGIPGSAQYGAVWSAFSSADVVIGALLRGGTAADSYVSSYGGAAFSRAAIRVSNSGYVSFLTAPSSTTAEGTAITMLEQARVVHTAGATRYITLTGSNGGNPTISTSAGSLAIATSVAITGQLSISTANPFYFDGGGNTYAQESTADNIQFVAGGAEMFRIDQPNGTVYVPAGKFFGIGGSPSFALHVVKSSDTATDTVLFANSAATATNQYGMQVNLSGDPNDATRYFAHFTGNVTQRATLRSNGGFANFSANDVNLSDLTLKSRAFENYWQVPGLIDKLWLGHKRMRDAWGRFMYDDQTHNDFNHGYGAQLVRTAWEGIADELVDEGWGKDDSLMVVYDNDLTHITGAVVTEMQFKVDELLAWKAKAEAALAHQGITIH